MSSTLINLTQLLANTNAVCPYDVKSLMAASMEGDQLLIKEIFKYPILYDSKRIDYKDTSKKDVAWITIATLLGLSVADCQRRWKTLRERYVREKKRFKKGSGMNSGLSDKWPLFDLMSFLGVFIKHRNSGGCFPMDDLSVMDTTQFCSIKQEEHSPDSMHEDMSMVVMVTPMTSVSPLSTIAPMPTVTTLPTIAPLPNLSSMTTVTPVTTDAPITVSCIDNVTSSEQNVSSGSSIELSPEVFHMNRLNQFDSEHLTQEVFHTNRLNQVDNDRLTQSSLNHTKNKLRDIEAEKGFLKTLDSSIKYLSSLKANHRDAEDHFAMSIACTLRKLPSQKAALAKIKIQQLLYELEFED